MHQHIRPPSARRKLAGLGPAFRDAQASQRRPANSCRLMARFYFHLHLCGTVIPDSEGQDYPDAVEAVQMARKKARTVMAAEVLEGRLCLGCHIEIVDSEASEATIVRFNNALRITGLDHPG